jgi:hypothetical protein
MGGRSRRSASTASRVFVEVHAGDMDGVADGLGF